MSGIVDFFVNADIMELASQPKVIAVVAVMFIAGLFLRWKSLCVGIGAGSLLIVLMKYTNISGSSISGDSGMDQNMIAFIGGLIVIMGGAIYFLFIRD